MKVALVSDTYAPQVNGVSTVVLRIARAVLGAGHRVEIVAPRYPSEDAAEPGVLRIPSLPFPPYPSIRLSVPLARRVAAHLDRFGPDLVHVHTEGPLGWVGRGYALRRRLPLVTSYHTHFPDYARHYGAGVLTPLVWRYVEWFHRPARLTQTPGEDSQVALRVRGLNQVVVWGRGVDTRAFRPDLRDAGWREWLTGQEPRVVVLHVGRLAPEKNLGVLIAAWREAHERLGRRAVFVIAGEGPERARVVRQLPFAWHLGFLDRPTLAALYATADLCVLPSATETCGLVALEAMASGLPVVAADAGGLRESVRHGETGLLVAPDQPRLFADAIVTLVENAERRRAYGLLARLRAVERDVITEDAELLSQYAAIAGEEASCSCAA